VLESVVIFDRVLTSRGLSAYYHETQRVKKRIRILSEDALEVREPPLLMWDANEVKESLQKKYGSLK
jgi:hypothetical protein